MRPPRRVEETDSTTTPGERATAKSFAGEAWPARRSCCAFYVQAASGLLLCNANASPIDKPTSAESTRSFGPSTKARFCKQPFPATTLVPIIHCLQNAQCDFRQLLGQRRIVTLVARVSIDLQENPLFDALGSCRSALRKTLPCTTNDFGSPEPAQGALRRRLVSNREQLPELS